LATSTSKKVQIYRFDRETISGFVSPPTYLTAGGAEILTLTGSVLMVSYGEIKLIAYVRDFGAEEMTSARRTFLSRPKLDGLWLRFDFRDRDTLEAIMANNLLQVEEPGFHAIPPDGAQRVFVPRQALTGVQVLGVVGSPLRMKRKPAGQRQIGLFEESA
jgi:hypothetical protein